MEPDKKEFIEHIIDYLFWFDCVNCSNYVPIDNKCSYYMTHGIGCPLLESSSILRRHLLIEEIKNA
jgi:hypothetical protein